MKLYSPKAIANYFLALAAKNGDLLTPMKLQKLVYYAMGWYAGYTGKPLLDEAAEAWQYGPVFPSLYHEFKRFGSGAVKGKGTELSSEEFEIVEVPVPDDENVRKFLDNIWASYGKFTGIALSEMTHKAGSPWDETYKASQGVRNVSIPFETIRVHFKEAADKAQSLQAAG